MQYQCDPRLIIQITSPLYGILDHARFVPRFTPRLLGSLSNSSSNQRDVYSACPSVVFEEIFIVTFAQQLTRETDSRFQDSGVFRRLLPRYARFYGISRRENTRAFHWNRSAMSVSRIYARLYLLETCPYRNRFTRDRREGPRRRIELPTPSSNTFFVRSCSKCLEKMNFNMMYLDRITVRN